MCACVCERMCCAVHVLCALCGRVVLWSEESARSEPTHTNSARKKPVSGSGGLWQALFRESEFDERTVVGIWLCVELFV